MDVFAIAAELLGDVKLTSGQLGQLRALDYRLLLDSVRRPHPGSASTAAGATGDEPGVGASNDDVLRARIAAEILEMLTPDQRARVSGR